MKFSEIEGKTIRKLTRMKFQDYDDARWIRMEFTDGTGTMLRGGYGGRSSTSFDEYPALVWFNSNSGYTKLTPTEALE